MTNNVPESIINFANAIKNLINTKANKTNGVSEITDSNSDDYSHIATMQSGATQQTINDSVNIELGKTVKKSNTPGLLKNDGTVLTNYVTSDDITNSVSTHNSNNLAHQDIRQLIDSKISKVDFDVTLQDNGYIKIKLDNEEET